jgi:hypothetical protein
VIWREFEASAPALAELGRQRFAATHVALLGTLRRDGSPRISPIEPYLVLDHLLLGMLSGSHKAVDLMRDPRCAIHSSISDVNGAEGEFKIHGRATLVTDPALLHGDPAAWWNAEDASEARVFSVSIESAAHLAWDIENGEMTMMRWSPKSGLRSGVQGY